MHIGFIRRPTTESPTTNLNVSAKLARAGVLSQIQAYARNGAPQISFADRLNHRSTHQKSDGHDRPRRANGGKN